MLTVLTIFPLMSVILVPAGICSASPGIRGLLMMVAVVVGAGRVAAWAISSTGIQLVNGRTLVTCGNSSTLPGKMPKDRPSLLAVVAWINKTPVPALGPAI